jgi:flagellar L-ring protein precursor FlgH
MSRSTQRIVTAGAVVFSLAWSAWMCRADGHDAPKSGSRPTGSLWSGSSRSWTEDVKAHGVGDTLTILVQETSSASSAASTKASKNESGSFAGGTGFLKPLLKNFGASSSTSMDGQGQTVRTGSLVTRLTVVVKEVMPNGNLVVEGTRLVGVNNEKQKATISGIVRPQDINPDNTVSSVSVANATIQYDGKGVVGEKQRKGIISTIFGWIF